MKPKILLSVNTKREFYVDAVNNCGGIAVPKYCPDVSTDYDGLVLCGGNDINPTYYKEEINGSVNIDNDRDFCEFELVKAFIDKNKPIMGICRGCQLLNIALGGSLHQDIPNAKDHSSFSDYDLVHAVTAKNGSFIYDLYGDSFCVNSFHHQAIKVLADNLRVIMTAGDIIEGFEHESLPIFGVQFHPERMCFSQNRDDTVDGAEIFEYFVNLCKENKERQTEVR